VRLDSFSLYFVASYHATASSGPGRLSPLGRALRAFKDRGDRYAGRCLCALFADQAEIAVRTLDRIIPVPSDPGRLRLRGFSPAAWLAMSLLRKTGVPICTTALERIAGRPAQKNLDGRSRRVNAAGIFRSGRASVSGCSIALVDDVITSGSTLADAAASLRAAGASRVLCFTLACADQELIEQCRSTTAADGRNATSRP
jgi:ComF family protein